MASQTSSLEKLALEDQEVRQGEERRLQLFARKSNLQDPKDVLAEGLDLVKNSQERDDRAFVAPFKNLYEEHIAGSDVPDDLDSVSQILNHEWREFKQSLEKEQREQDGHKLARIPKRFHGIWGRKDPHEGLGWRISTPQEHPVAYEDIEKSVKDAQEHWRSKKRLRDGKPQEYFHSFCKSLNAHSNLLKILPNQNQYFSIFCGVTNTLIKASVNHQNVAEHFDKALADINSWIGNCNRHLKLMDTLEMRAEIQCLYSEVFRFLSSAMKWYKKGACRKMLNSLKQDQADELKEHLDKIKSLCDSIRHNSQLRSQAELRDLRLQYQHDKTQDRLVQEERYEGLHNSMAQMRLNSDRAAKQGKLDREQERQEMYHDHILRAIREAIGNEVDRLLQGILRTWLNEEEKPNPNTPILGLTTRRLTEDVEPRARIKRSNKSKGATIKMEDLQLWSKDMEDFTTNVPEFLESIDLDIAVAEQEILEAIQDWIQSSNSRALWVRGKPQESYPSNVTTIAARVVSVVLRWNIPLLCYFSNSEDDDNDACMRSRINPGNTSGGSILIDLIYSLIRQLINQLLPETKMHRNLTKDHFEDFDGSIETFERALKLFKQLFQYGPANIYLIIDGIERLDDDPACESLLKFLTFLEDMIIDTGSNRIVKLLYTTAGECESLERLDDDFLEFVKPKARKAKHRRRGMKRLREFDPERELNSSDSLIELSDSG